jgi:hypothetical protein
LLQAGVRLMLKEGVLALLKLKFLDALAGNVGILSWKFHDT